MGLIIILKILDPQVYISKCLDIVNSPTYENGRSSLNQIKCVWISRNMYGYHHI